MVLASLQPWTPFLKVKMKVVNLKCFQLTSCCCWFKFELNEFNLQVVAVGNDVAAEVAVAAVVGDWKGFREGFPAKGGFVENGTCGQIATTNLGRVPRWASFASLSTTPSSSPYTWSTTSSGSTSAPHSLIISYNIWNIRCIRYNPDDIDQVHAPVSQQLSTLTPIFSPNYIPLFLLPPRKVRGDGLTSHGGSPALSKSSFCKLRKFLLQKNSRFSSTVWEIVTLAVSEWKTSSAAKRVCMLVTRKRIRLSCSAGNSSWSSEFWVLGQWCLRWHYWLLLAIIFILFTWVEDLVGPLCIFHALLKVSCCLFKIFIQNALEEKLNVDLAWPLS